MEERKWNGDIDLTDFADLVRGTQDQEMNMLKNIIDAAKKEENKLVALHKPKSVVTMKDGTQYQVMPNGSWKKLKKSSD